MQVKKFRNWMIHITIIKRWLFSRCRLCGNRFTWKDCATGHVLSPSLNGCGPKWFRNAENIVHMPTCDPQTWKQDYDEAVTDSTRTRASQSHWGKIYYTNRQYAKDITAVFPPPCDCPKTEHQKLCCKGCNFPRTNTEKAEGGC